MQGKLKVIPAMHSPVINKDLTAPPPLKELQGYLNGGYIELVPRFDTFDGKRCIAYCDEDGKRKRLPVNVSATVLWAKAMGVDINYMRDELRGDVIILTGDDEFMRAQ